VGRGVEEAVLKAASRRDQKGEWLVEEGPVGE